MKQKINWLSKWFFLPFRFIYLIAYCLCSCLFKVKNEGFQIYYNKKENTIYSGWKRFYDTDKWWKEIILSSLEIHITLIFLIAHSISQDWMTGIIFTYCIFYLLFKFQWKMTLKFVLNWKYNNMIRKYVGDELYYYAKWNYEDLTLSFPELSLINKDTEIINMENKENVALDTCRKIWNNNEYAKDFCVTH